MQGRSVRKGGLPPLVESGSSLAGASHPSRLSITPAEPTRLHLLSAMMNRMTREELDEIIQSLEQTPAEVSLLLDQISPHEQMIKNADEFSALENICHLRDIELEGYTKRILRILQDDMPSLADIDGGRLAIERDYNNQSADEALEAFSAARRRNLELLAGLRPEQLEREGTLENVGVISLQKLIEMIIEHDQGHLAELQIIQRRAQRPTSDAAGL